MREREAASEVFDSALNYEAALADCASGSPSAVAQIYIAETTRLRAFARGIVRNRDGAEDVIHDAFVQILRDAKNFDPRRGSARAWIYTIVRNTALKSRRSALRQISADDDKLESLRQQPQPVADNATRLAEDADLRSYLEQLEPRRCATLILAIIDGRTHAEIAEYLGVPMGTVKAWIRRELIALRKRLG
jgi:RNA polymerase sigma-70 factor (ECF subfamily)